MMDCLSARRYQHAALGDRPVVRLVPDNLAEAADLTQEFYGFQRPARVHPVGQQARQGLGFPDWALIHDPDRAAFALEVVKEFRVQAKIARSRPGAAKDGMVAIGERLGRSVPHFLPSFYEECGRTFLALENANMATQFFNKAREAEKVHALQVDENLRRDTFLEFALAGAVARYLPLQLPDFSVDWAALEGLINSKTRAILVNTPGNPCGKVFSQEELAQLAELAQRHPHLLFITDEVYEHIVFAPARHACLAAQPGMRERTLVISSFSKTLSMTGWKVGYVFAPPHLTAAVRASHQFLTFCSASPLQAALAEVMDRLPAYVDELAAEYLQRRDLWCSLLDAAGMPSRVPQGRYFVISDVRSIGHQDDVEFCRWITQQLGVAAIPASAFYHTPEAGRALVRWAFCKGFDT